MDSDPVARLEIKNLCRHFGPQTVVDHVSLRIVPGQVTCLLGPSGCGKSTTLRMIAGVDQQNSGEIYIDGKLISGGNIDLPPSSARLG